MPAHLDKFFSFTKLVIKQSIQSVLNVNKSWRYTELLITLNRDNKEIAERVENILGLQKTNLTNNVIKLAEATLQIKKNNELIMHLADKTNLLDPVNTLKRGYSITRLNGKALTETKELSAGMQLETKLADGIVFSRVEEKQ